MKAKVKNYLVLLGLVALSSASYSACNVGTNSPGCAKLVGTVTDISIDSNGNFRKSGNFVSGSQYLIATIDIGTGSISGSATPCQLLGTKYRVGITLLTNSGGLAGIADASLSTLIYAQQNSRNVEVIIDGATANISCVLKSLTVL